MGPGAVCFDFDDTLVLSEEAKAAHFLRVAREHHGEEGEALMASLSGDRYERFERYAAEVASRGLQPAASVGSEPPSGKAMAEQYCREIAEIVGRRCTEVPGAAAGLLALRADGVSLFLNSATPHDDLLAAVRSRGWEEHFAGVMGRPSGVSVETSKVDNLRRCMREAGVGAEKLVMVGDGESDRVSAAEVGCCFVGIRGRKPFEAEVPHLARDMVEALGLIRRVLSEGQGQPLKKVRMTSEGFRRVLQTDFTPGSGNALQAAVASAMHLELDAVPNFLLAPEGYEVALAEWLRSKGRRMYKLALDREGRLPPAGASPAAFCGMQCIVRGTSPRGDHGHVVAGRVGADGRSVDLVHDPHPDGAFLRPPLVWCALFPPEE